MSPQRTCPRCGDPLPVDGACDCAGDPERDYQTGHRELESAHAQIVRLGPKTGNPSRDAVVELWL